MALIRKCSCYLTWSRSNFQYTSQQDGSVLGVSVSRSAMLAHARTITSACNYTEGEIMVCVLVSLTFTQV